MPSPYHAKVLGQSSLRGLARHCGRAVLLYIDFNATYIVLSTRIAIARVTYPSVAFCLSPCIL